MPSYLEKKTMRYCLFALIGVTVVLLAIMALYNWILSLVALLLFGIPFYLLFKFDYEQRKETEEYISTLSYRVKKVGKKH